MIVSGHFLSVRVLLLAALSFPLTACVDETDEAASDSSGVQLIDLNSFQEADVVVGQADFNWGARDQGGVADATTIDSPFGNPGFHNGVLYLPDHNNNRVLGYLQIPKKNDAVADFVLGQPDFTSTASGVSATEFSGSQTVFFDQGKMFLVSYDNNRVLIWDKIPASGGVPADWVVGQVNSDSKAANCSAAGLRFPDTGWAVDGKLIVTDSGNHRVLIWNSIPTRNGVPADIVLGQQDFINCQQNAGTVDEPTAATLNFPAGVWSDGDRLVVSDRDNNRVLIWNDFPAESFTPADVVLGQYSFTVNAPNDDDQDGDADLAASNRTLAGPYDGVYSNGVQLFIADSDNNRLLVWNSFPTSNFSPADVVLGQGSFKNNAPNDDGQSGSADRNPGARTLSFPTGVLLVGDQLIVADGNNHRYLIYDGK
ncbi:MAG: hypothetical protein L3J89_11575 [Gammaproteobacteria bacterium]|nr:hypothetical protein [Gammaproteobacteria bacterium]